MALNPADLKRCKLWRLPEGVSLPIGNLPLPEGCPPDAELVSVGFDEGHRPVLKLRHPSFAAAPELGVYPYL